MSAAAQLRLGLDLGGTKLAGVVMALDGEIVAARRVPSPRDDYVETLQAIEDLVERLEHDVGGSGNAGDVERASHLVLQPCPNRRFRRIVSQAQLSANGGGDDRRFFVDRYDRAQRVPLVEGGDFGGRAGGVQEIERQQRVFGETLHRALFFRRHDDPDSDSARSLHEIASAIGRGRQKKQDP